MARLIPSTTLCLFALFFVFFAVDAEVPSYIHVCGRRNPQVDQCIQDSVHALLPKLKNGLPDLDVPPLEPMEMEEMTLAQLDTFKAVATNCKISGLSNFYYKHYHADFEKKQFDMELVFPEVIMNADYDVKAKILVPINEKGPIQTVSKDVVAKVVLKYELVQRRGRTLIYFPSINMKLHIGDYEAVFRPTPEGGTENPMSQAINQVLVTSRQEIIDSMTPNIEKTVSKKMLELSNKICKHFTFDELFPDRV
ncbi:uncharacterized protein LOC106640805 [Copidosoma floridanum]|uniref:uncharacterized protein LOC106640805 n=1 Tax=Copidosoma floridanum TaxID=29053 RepID=UPI0006C9DB9B|nr:uncharacterized protein LOC106640805 [Copidosoma floridanum]